MSTGNDAEKLVIHINYVSGLACYDIYFSNSNTHCGYYIQLPCIKSFKKSI